MYHGFYLAWNLRLQAATPSDHLWAIFLLPTAPQLLNQAPPGAQQLNLPDFFLITHLGHTRPIDAVMVSVVTDVVSIPAVVMGSVVTDIVSVRAVVEIWELR